MSPTIKLAPNQYVKLAWDGTPAAAVQWSTDSPDSVEIAVQESTLTNVAVVTLVGGSATITLSDGVSEQSITVGE